MLNFYYQVGYSGVCILILGLIAIFMAVRGTVLVLLLKKQGLRANGISQQIINTVQCCEYKHANASTAQDPTTVANCAITTSSAASASNTSIKTQAAATINSNFPPNNRELLINTLMQVHMKGIYAAMYYLKLCAAIGPLLGLLGTVLGMVDVFSNLSSQTMPDPRMLAGGIWEALLTTVMGLSLAIPALIGHYFLLINLRWLRNQINLALSNLKLNNMR